MMDKKAQLGWIEFKYFVVGVILGLVIGVILLGLSCNKIWLPRIGFLCG